MICYSYATMARGNSAFLKIDEGVLNGTFACHTHDFNELVFIKSGTGIHIIDDEEYAVQKGDVFVIKGSTVHGFRAMNQLKILNIAFFESSLFSFGDYERLPGFWALFVNQPSFQETKEPLVLTERQFQEFEELCDAFLKEYEGGEDGYLTLCSSYFYQAIVYLSRLYQRMELLQNTVYFRLGKALSYVSAHFTEDISLQSLADISFLSKRHFSRIFKEVYGKTPLQYIMSLRINYAKKLLSHPDSNITDIATTCGFSDSNYFSRTFKNFTGKTPKEWKSTLQ